MNNLMYYFIKHLFVSLFLATFILPASPYLTYAQFMNTRHGEYSYLSNKGDVDSLWHFPRKSAAGVHIISDLTHKIWSWCMQQFLRNLDQLKDKRHLHHDSSSAVQTQAELKNGHNICYAYTCMFVHI